jgi:DNA-binding MarR family transcriptional regulator
MFEEKSILVDFFGDTPFIKVIDFLIENIGYEYTKAEIAKGSGIDWSTLSKMLDRMERYKLIVPVRKEGKELYRLNEKNSLVKDLLTLEMDLIEEYSEEEMVVPVK